MKPLRLSLWRIVVCIASACAAAGADVIRVPDDFTSIQGGILAASPGDTVLVGPGTYVENLDFLGKRVTVRSIEGAAATIIDGDQNGSVAVFVNGERSSTVLEGFTLRNGTGTVAGNGLAYGGGVFTAGSAPTVRDCVIRGNVANNGGGIWLCGTGAGNVALFERCELIGNVAGSAGGFGGTAGGFGCESAIALWFDSSLIDNSAVVGGGVGVITASTVAFESCRLLDNGARDSGGGAYAGPGTVLRMFRCDIDDSRLLDTASAEGGGVYSEDADLDLQECRIRRSDVARPSARVRGGGVYLAGRGRIERCLIEDNHAPRGGGGGLALQETAATTTFVVEGNRFVGNRTDQTGGGLVIYNTASAEIVLRSNVFVDNEANVRGGAIHVAGGSGNDVLRLMHNTLIGNRSPQGAAIRYEARRPAFFANGIVYHHESAESAISDQFDTLEFATSVIEGGRPGPGVFDVDPRIVASRSDAHLQMDSPCIDAADELLGESEDYDFDGDLRGIDGDGDGIGIADIGADEMRREVAARYGAVRENGGDLVSLLRISGDAGDERRTVRIAANAPVELTIDAPPAGPAMALYVLYVWIEAPDITTITLHPLGLGWMAFPTLITHPPGSPNLPFAIVNTLGHEARLGRSRFPLGIDPTPAPVGLTLQSGPSIPSRFTVQAIIEDLGSDADALVSVTNAVVLEIEP